MNTLIRISTGLMAMLVLNRGIEQKYSTQIIIIVLSGLIVGAIREFEEK